MQRSVVNSFLDYSDKASKSAASIVDAVISEIIAAARTGRVRFHKLVEFINLLSYLVLDSANLVIRDFGEAEDQLSIYIGSE